MLLKGIPCPNEWGARIFGGLGNLENFEGMGCCVGNWEMEDGSVWGCG